VERPDETRSPAEPADDNSLEYRNVDEEGEYDERGSQGTGAGEPPPDEEGRKPS